MRSKVGQRASADRLHRARGRLGQIVPHRTIRAYISHDSANATEQATKPLAEVADRLEAAIDLAYIGERRVLTVAPGRWYIHMRASKRLIYILICCGLC